MDFFDIKTREIDKGPRKGHFEVYPDFKVCRSKDLMVRGRAFYAIWDEEAGLWSTDEYDVQRLVDQALIRHAEEQSAAIGVECHARTLSSFGTNGWTMFRRYVSQISDNAKTVDNQLTFINTDVKKEDYVTRRLPYSLEEGPHPAWDELLSVLYDPEERAKIEWAIGAIIIGDSKKIQKFVVFHGQGGTGKSTIMNIIEMLFVGYTATFDAKNVVGSNNSFSVESFKTNPLVAIQHDSDLSKIEDGSKLNSIISHEVMTMNEKFKPTYDFRCNAFLFLGTNKPVKISDAKSGIIRRLIDIKPTGRLIEPSKYNTLMAQVEFELGAIAYRCLQTYKDMGRNYYNGYRPLEMMFLTDVFFNFVEHHFDIFKDEGGISLKRAYAMYKEYCESTGIEFTLPQYKFREELKNYFSEFHERYDVDGVQQRNYYKNFVDKHFAQAPVEGTSKPTSNEQTLVFDSTDSLFDREFSECPAQYANKDGLPKKRWADVTTKLSDIDTRRLHYVKVPETHIIIDFDIKDEDGQKSLERNIKEASSWPATYGEYSKSGSGLHLHYNYTGGEPSRLSPNYADGIEVKVFRGDASLRRMLTRCSSLPISNISSGLPLKEKKVLSHDKFTSERGLRELIYRNLRKEIHPGTKPSVDFIKHILDEAYDSGMAYDVTDLRADILAFANGSTNQALTCLKLVQLMRFKSEPPWDEAPKSEPEATDDRLVFFDVEVFPNLFVVCWKFQGPSEVVRMINPGPSEIEALTRFKLVGFNVRRYDNHILYARLLGYDNERLHALSQKIIQGSSATAFFGEAYNLSYTDIYDFSSVKQSLKKFEIQLGLNHMELGMPWDEPVDEKDWSKVADYCANDVYATEAVFESRKGDFTARQILAELSGLTVNDTTQRHTAKIIFGNDRNPQRSFVYTDLSKMFPGYTYDRGVSSYRGETVGEGGYVYAEPGIHEKVALLDVASMHPTSIIALGLFGPVYTKKFAELVKARLAIKHKDYETARSMLDGRLAKFLVNPEEAKALAYALKIVINIVYGLTSAKFENPFRDPRNKDNIVAKRGALFMIDLKHAVQERGFIAAHIKTDSIKIPNATQEIIDFVFSFGDKYGYTFEHESTYDKLCLVNDAVYIARETECTEGVHWTAVGAQFQHPYVYKRLFSKEDVTFEDLCEARQVSQGVIHMDYDDNNLPWVLNSANYGKDEGEKKRRDYELDLAIKNTHFVGKTGLFVPVRSGYNGATLYRIKDGKPYAVSGTKGYKWLEAVVAREIGIDCVDMRYFDSLVDNAIAAIEYYGPFVDFVG